MDRENLENITEKILKQKIQFIDNFNDGNYIDAMDEAKTWCIAEVVVRKGNFVKVHYEGWSSKYDEEINIKNTNKINHFRRFSKGYTGQKKVAFRDYNYSDNDLTLIKETIRDLKHKNFQGFKPLFITQFIRGKIFTFLDILMTISHKEPSKTISNIVELIYDFIDLSIKYLEFFKENFKVIDYLDKFPDLILIDDKCAVLACYYEIIISLKRIFGRDERNNDEYLKIIPPRTANDYLYYKENKSIGKDIVYSKVINNFINYFAEKEGFLLIKDIILMKSDKVLLPLYILDSFLSVYCYIEPYIDYKNQFNSEIILIKINTSMRILSLTEHEIKELNKSVIHSIAHSIQKIFSFDDNHNKYYEEMILNYHWKCLISKILEKRINGISSLNCILDNIEKKDKGQDFSSDDNESDEKFQFFNQKTFLNYLKEKNILEELMGEHIHEEILKRSSPILKLFTRFNSLNKNFFDHLLKIRNQLHETIAKQIEILICDLTTFLSHEDKLYIFNKIIEVNDNKFDLKFLTFIKNYSINSISGKQSLSEIDRNLYGIPLFWKILQDSFKISEKDYNFIENCLQFLFELLNDTNIAIEIVEKYIMMCFENLKNNFSVVQSLNLLKKLIESITIRYRKIGSTTQTKEFIINLFHKGNLLSSVINDLVRYMKNNYNKRKELKLDSSNDILNTIFEGYYTHKLNLDSRLNIIYLIIIEAINYSIFTDYTFLEQIWDQLIINAVDDNEANTFIRFLLRKQENNGVEDTFSRNIGEYLFNNILIVPEKNNPSNLNIMGYLLFSRYFKLINIRSNNILLIKGNFFRVCSSNIIGFNFLLNILINNSNDIVMNKFAKILLDICINFVDLNSESNQTYWKFYFDLLYQKLKDCKANNNENGIKAILTLFKLIVKSISEGGEIPTFEEITFSQNGLDYIFFSNQRNYKKEIKISDIENCFSVRQKLAYYLQIHIDKLSFKHYNIIIDYTKDSKIFKDLITVNSELEIIENDHPIISVKQNPMSILIDNNNIFHLLFDLLHNVNASYINVAWEFINILPKNIEIEEEIKIYGNTIKNVDWEKLLDSKSIYKMLYSLKIITCCIKGEEVKMIDCEITEKQINEKWVENFYLNGGVSHLFKLIYQFELNHFDKVLGYECLNNILNIFTLISSSCSNEINLKKIKDVNYIELLYKFCEIMIYIFKSSALRDNDKTLISLQTAFMRQKQKNLFKKLNLMNEPEDTLMSEVSEDLENYHPVIRENFISEDYTINQIYNFLVNFLDSEILIEFFSKNHILKEIIHYGFIFPKNFRIKYSTFLIFKRLFLINTTLTKQLIKSFFEKLFDKETLELTIKQPNTSEAFYKIVINFITSFRVSLIYSYGEVKINRYDLIDYAVNYIKNFTFGNEIVLNGLFSILRNLILDNEKDLIYLESKHKILETLISLSLKSNGVINKLININSSNQNITKLKSPLTKESSFKLLSAMSFNSSQNILKVLEILINYHSLGFWRSKSYFDWLISPNLDGKSSTGYTGLKNLGCTCYMNSLLQQFFMIPTLRENILKCPNIAQGESNKEESVLYNMKKVFGFLKASDRKFHNPRDFFSNFKNWENQPINVMEQMDVDEFGNMLIDKLENELKSTKYEKIFKYHFAGKLSNELICKGCPHYSEREESYFNLSLQVKNKKSLQESLESFVAGEMLEGDNAYFCEKCQKKVNTLRRVCIKKLPKYLILVLKRFEFDFDTMQKIKVNDYCSFPLELNMENYTQEYLTELEKKKDHSYNINNDSNQEKDNIQKNKKNLDNYYKYNLNGVIIHTGFADSGHYYSIIKDHNSSWFEFNDTNVRNYDINDLSNEAFGGLEQQKNQNEKLTNAYLLFYKREADFEDQEDNVFNSILNENNFENIENDIMEFIKDDNYQCSVSKIIFSNLYFEFAQDLLINYNTETSTNYFKYNLLRNPKKHQTRQLYSLSNLHENAFCYANYNRQNLMNWQHDQNILTSDIFNNILFKFGCILFFTSLSRTKDKLFLPGYIDILKGYINRSTINADWLLEEFSNFETLIEFLVDCPILEIKRVSAGLIHCCLLKSYDINKISIVKEESIETLLSYSLINFVNALIILLGKKSKFTKDFTYIYLVLYRISSLSSEMCGYLMKHKVVLYILFLYFQRNNLFPSVIKGLLSKGVKLKTYSMEEIIQVPKRDPHHYEINLKTIGKVNKMTAYEEFNEKKILEKMEKSSNQNESFLMMALCEIIKNKDFYGLLSNEEKILLEFSNSDTVKVLLYEIKSPHSCNLLSTIFSEMCFNNMDNTNCLFNALVKLLENSDYMDLEFALKIYFKFMIIEDSFSKQRLSATLKKIFEIIELNTKYYKLSESFIEFVIKIFSTKFELFSNYVSLYKDNLISLIAWLKDNPSPPIYYPSKSTSLFKYRNYNYQTNPQFSQAAINSYVMKTTNISNEKINKLNEIINRNEKAIKEFNISEDNLCDLTDFTFSVNDRVKVDNNIGTVIIVLDEMIKVEFTEISQNQKKTYQEWVETSYKNLLIIELYDSNKNDGDDIELYR